MLDEGTAGAVVGRILPKWEHAPPEWMRRMVASGVFGPFALLDLGETPVRTEHFLGGNLFIPPTRYCVSTASTPMECPRTCFGIVVMAKRDCG